MTDPNWADEFDSGLSNVPTPYAVYCNVHGHVYLTHTEYLRQMYHANELWHCPMCPPWECGAQWDDKNYESYFSDYDGPDTDTGVDDGIEFGRQNPEEGVY